MPAPEVGRASGNAARWVQGPPAHHHSGIGMLLKRAIITTVAGLTFSSTALALGLGTIEQDSFLNQPLSARIPLEASDRDKLEDLQVTMAPEEVFDRAGLDRPHYLRDIRFEVVEDDADGPHVRVYTRNPFREPFVDFLVELNWPQGRLIREYTLLLDPPRDSDEAPAPPTAPATERRDVEGVPISEAERAPSAQPGVRDGQYGPVSDGETLWAIAEQARAEGVNAHQMAVALFEANPEAFVDGDINRLRRGATLEVPSANQARQLDADQARERFRQLASAPAEAPVTDEPDADVAETEPPADVLDSEQLDQQLQIVAESDRNEEEIANLLDGDIEPSEENIGALREELIRAREEQASLRSENEDLRARLADMQDELARLERLVTVELEEGVPVPVDPADSEVTTEAPEEEPETAPTDPDVADAEPAVEDDALAEEDEEAAPAQPPTGTEPRPTGWLDGLSLPLAIGGLAILIGLLALMLLRRRRGETGVAAEEVPIAEPPAREAGVAAGGVAVAAAAGEGAADEADPLKEADRLAEAGDLDGARETLIAALNNTPARSEYRLRLLEVLSETGDRQAFDQQAQALWDRVDGQSDPHWVRAVTIGQAFAPDNPLFGGDQSAAGAPEVEDASGTATLPTLGEPDAAAEDQSDLKRSDEPFGGDLAFDLDLPETERSADGAETRQGSEPHEPDADDGKAADAGVSQRSEGEGMGDLSLDFEVDDSWRDRAESAEQAEGADKARDDEFDLDFGGLNLDDVAAQDASDDGTAAPTDDRAADDEPEPGAEADEEEIATKLDLARAYVDLGDPDGARELLNEVVSVGSPEQKKEAQALLDSLG